MSLLLLAAGLVLLYYGSEFLVRGSSNIAVSLGIDKMVVGLTVVALGTSMPEFVVSLFSAVEKVDNISTGNIVGSNIANILLALGLASVIMPIIANKRTLKVDVPVVTFISLLFVFMCRDGNLTRIDGLILLITFILYMTYNLINRKDINVDHDELERMETGHLVRNCLLTVGGVAGLVLGGDLTVRGAVGVAEYFGISDLVIGMTVVALGTSLPEVFTSVVAVIKKEADISVGNIIGSNIFNIAFILGVVPMVNPLKVDPAIIRTDNYYMLATTLLFALFIYHKKQLGRIKGAILVTLYVAFIAHLLFAAG